MGLYAVSQILICLRIPRRLSLSRLALRFLPSLNRLLATSRWSRRLVVYTGSLGLSVTWYVSAWVGFEPPFSTRSVAEQLQCFRRMVVRECSHSRVGHSPWEDVPARPASRLSVSTPQMTGIAYSRGVEQRTLSLVGEFRSLRDDVATQHLSGEVVWRSRRERTGGGRAGCCSKCSPVCSTARAPGFHGRGLSPVCEYGTVRLR